MWEPIVFIFSIQNVPSRQCFRRHIIPIKQTYLCGNAKSEVADQVQNLANFVQSTFSSYFVIQKWTEPSSGKLLSHMRCYQISPSLWSGKEVTSIPIHLRATLQLHSSSWPSLYVPLTLSPMDFVNSVFFKCVCSCAWIIYNEQRWQSWSISESRSTLPVA